jgi:hypothetical protein
MMPTMTVLPAVVADTPRHRLGDVAEQAMRPFVKTISSRFSAV